MTITSIQMDKRADEIAAALEPIMRDTFMSIQSLELQYDKQKWADVLTALTQKMPKRLRALPLSKEDRMELLSLIDIIDRTVMEKGPDATAQTLFRAFVGMFDLFGRFRRALDLKVVSDGEDITEEIFGD